MCKLAASLHIFIQVAKGRCAAGKYNNTWRHNRKQLRKHMTHKAHCKY